MRQVRDTLVWLAMIVVVAGVVYVMPRVANYVAAARERARTRLRDLSRSQCIPVAPKAIAHHHHH